jgi:CRISPR-associated endonuclease/helicase Cas3
MDLASLKFWAKTTADGKPGVDVFHHMLNVGYVALEIVKQYPELLSRFGLTDKQAAVMAALHDIGKISPGFQQKCDSWLEENGLTEEAGRFNWSALQTNHALISQFTLERLLIKNELDKYSSTLWAAAIGAHHGKLIYNGEGGIRSQAGMQEDEWEILRQQTAKFILEEMGKVPLLPAESNNPILWWLAGLTTVSDWIGSDENHFPNDTNLAKKDIIQKAQEAIERIGFEVPLIKRNNSFKQIFGFDPNSLQQKAMEHIKKPGIYVIEAPMGMGKTEAALAVAYQLLRHGLANGIYFALPTQVTSNRIHTRVDEFIGNICETVKPVRLIHGNSWLTDTNLPTPEVTSIPDEGNFDQKIEDDWFSSPKRALLSSFGVGTVDQALMGVITVKHFFVRQFALAGKVVILDEVHSYDMYTGTLIDQLCKALAKLGATVIILSATLTADRRKELIGSNGHGAIVTYPLISGRITEEEILQPLGMEPPEDKSIKLSFVKEEIALSDVWEKAMNGASILWICDTVLKSQEIFEFFKQQTAGSAIEIGLLHSRFPYFRREEIENKWLDKLGKKNLDRKGCILVATQVVEQSVDIDADLIVTELAPTDMLLQRIGRLWRHMTEHPKESRPVSEPEVWIIQENFHIEETVRMASVEIKKAFGSKAYVYAPYVLLRSLAEFQKLPNSNIIIPSGIRNILEDTYSDKDKEPDSWMDLKNKMLENKTALAEKAKMFTNIWMLPESIDEEERAMTRVNSQPTVAVILSCVKRENTILLMDGVSEIPKKESKTGKKNPDIARKIHKNLVKVPAWIFETKPFLGYLPKYVQGWVTLAVPDENGILDVAGLKGGFKLRWSTDKGLEILKPTEAMDESGE